MKVAEIIAFLTDLGPDNEIVISHSKQVTLADLKEATIERPTFEHYVRTEENRQARDSGDNEFKFSRQELLQLAAEYARMPLVSFELGRFTVDICSNPNPLKGASMSPRASVEAVCDHIKASYPCSLRGAANWCECQGLEEHFGDAIAELIKQDEITLDIEGMSGYVTINPVINPKKWKFTRIGSINRGVDGEDVYHLVENPDGALDEDDVHSCMQRDYKPSGALIVQAIRTHNLEHGKVLAIVYLRYDN